jgi:uncharacterized protein (TIGR00297 family)
VRSAGGPVLIEPLAPFAPFAPFAAPSTARAAAGLASALAVALLARRARSLDDSGAAAATVVGAVAVAAGWGWGAYLMTFFVSSSALSRLGRREKARRTAGVVEKGGERDAAQVLANGGVFTLALGGAVAWSAAGRNGVATLVLGAAAAGALAAAAADTWATEVGTLVGGTPRSLRGWRAVPPGTSGAVSAAGTAAMLAGALALAGTARLLGAPGALALGAAVGGVAGALLDTLAGAALQERRRCDACGLATEQRVHDCGTPTRRTGGVPGIGNDLVNVSCTVAGALVGAGVALLAARRG